VQKPIDNTTSVQTDNRTEAQKSLDEYQSFVATLTDTQFAKYALDTRIGINLAKELQQRFLQNPEGNKQEVFDYFINEITKIDPDLAQAMLKIPDYSSVTIKNIEMLEDILELARKPENKDLLQNLYGKGINREMWPVALERLEYKASQGEFDVDNPLSGTELAIYTRLAEFQEKYNTEMDQQGVAGPRPAIRGINILHEPLGNQMTDYNGQPKSDDELKFEYALMKWSLRCNAVRLWASSIYGDSFYHAQLVQNEGMDAWSVFYPTVHPPYYNVTDSSLLVRYKIELSDYAEKAQSHNIKGLWVGAEFDAWWPAWGGRGGVASQNNADLRNYIDDLVRTARQKYSGPISYQEWDYWWQYDSKVNWKNMDMISLSPWVGHYNAAMRDNQTYLNTFINIKNKYGKPLYIVEVGSPSITEAEQVGGIDSLIPSADNHADQQKQATLITRYLNLLYQAGVDAVFICMWDEPASHAFGYGNSNEKGKGVWDYIKREPKLGFWSIYKYFKE